MHLRAGAAAAETLLTLEQPNSSFASPVPADIARWTRSVLAADVAYAGIAPAGGCATPRLGAACAPHKSRRTDGRALSRLTGPWCRRQPIILVNVAGQRDYIRLFMR